MVSFPKPGFVPRFPGPVSTSKFWYIQVGVGLGIGGSCLYFPGLNPEIRTGSPSKAPTSQLEFSRPISELAKPIKTAGDQKEAPKGVGQLSVSPIGHSRTQPLLDKNRCFEPLVQSNEKPHFRRSGKRGIEVSQSKGNANLPVIRRRS